MVDLEQEIRNSINILNKGGIILFPTDTIWGLGCNALNEAAILKIYEIKKCLEDKSFIILITEPKDIFQYVANPYPDIIAILDSFKEPTSVIFENVIGFPDVLLSQNGSLGIRVTNDIFCKSLIKRAGFPIVSTSANFYGEKTPKNFAEINPEIITFTNYVVKFRQKETILSKPSAIIKIEEDGNLNIIRK